MDSDGKLVDEDVQMCEEINSYFSSVFTREDLNVELPETEKLFNGDPHEELLDVFFDQIEYVFSRIMKLHECNKVSNVYSDSC